jgi:hypothetical protein
LHDVSFGWMAGYNTGSRGREGMWPAGELRRSTRPSSRNVSFIIRIWPFVIAHNHLVPAPGKLRSRFPDRSGPRRDSSPRAISERDRSRAVRRRPSGSRQFILLRSTL